MAEVKKESAVLMHRLLSTSRIMLPDKRMTKILMKMGMKVMKKEEKVMYRWMRMMKKRLKAVMT